MEPLKTKRNYNKKKNDIYLLYNNNEVKAAGILFYTIKDDKKYFLLTETNDKLSDIGGKIETCDKTILDIAIREFSEEVNGNCFFRKSTDSFCEFYSQNVIPHYLSSKMTNYSAKNCDKEEDCFQEDNDKKIDDLIEYLNKNFVIESEYYIPRSKYIIFVSYLSPEIMDLHNSNESFFGNREIKENRERKIFWKSIEQINEYKNENNIHPRLWNNKLWKNLFGEKLIEMDNDITTRGKFLFKN
jgi:hypothetical protein